VAYLAFPGFDVWPAGIVGVGALVWALEPLGPAMGYLAAAAFALTLFGPLLGWAAIAAGVIPWVLLVAMTVSLVGLVGLAWPMVRRLPGIRRSRILGALAFAAIWAAVEELRAVIPLGGFPWGRLAFSQASSPMAHLAWLGGAPLTSFAVALSGALAAGMVVHLRWGRTWGACAAAILAVAVAVGPTVIGLDARAERGSLRVGAIQGGGEGDVLPEGVTRARAVVDLHARLTEAMVRDLGRDAVDVVIWPEDSVAFDLGARPDVADELGRLASAVGAPLLIGSNEYPTDTERYNVSLLIDEEGRISDRYAKRHPVPFGEYMPWRSLARRVTAAADRVTMETLPGDDVGVVALPVDRTGQVVPIGEIICFEVAYDSLVRDAVAAGAQIIAVQTNNASFGGSAESEQQLAMSRLRAIEHGRSVVHISTTGASALISPAGIVLDAAAPHTPATLVDTVPLRTSLTPAARYGRAIGWGVAALGAGLALLGAAYTLSRTRRRG
jgi:apolipoprotein N-acyltransferase